MFFLTATLSSGLRSESQATRMLSVLLSKSFKSDNFLGEQFCIITGKASGAEEKPSHFQARVFSPRTTMEDPGLILFLMDPVFLFLFKTVQLHLKLQCTYIKVAVKQFFSP